LIFRFGPLAASEVNNRDANSRSYPAQDSVTEMAKLGQKTKQAALHDDQ
jgi:hypothetical protein